MELGLIDEDRYQYNIVEENGKPKVLIEKRNDDLYWIKETEKEVKKEYLEWLTETYEKKN